MSFQRVFLPAAIVIGTALLLAPSARATVSCCLPTDACEHTATADDCRVIGGHPFQYCCEDGACPPVGCIGATGSCNQPNPTPGCGTIGCCAAVCNVLPECCTGPWTEECAAAHTCAETADVINCCLADGCDVTGSSGCDNQWGLYVPNSADCEEVCESLCEAPITPFCGDGVLDLGEECDDGNVVDGDGCESDCTVGPAVPATSRLGVILLTVLLLTAAMVVLRLRSSRT